LFSKTGSSSFFFGVNIEVSKKCNMWGYFSQCDAPVGFRSIRQTPVIAFTRCLLAMDKEENSPEIY
jgi:hypothetical protein